MRIPMNRIFNLTSGWRSLHSFNCRISSSLNVEFAAFYKTNDTTGQLHEKSKFIHENDQWYYLDGLLLDLLKIGRNDSCWCGSNKKYKKCHGR